MAPFRDAPPRRVADEVAERIWGVGSTVIRSSYNAPRADPEIGTEGDGDKRWMDQLPSPTRAAAPEPVPEPASQQSPEAGRLRFQGIRARAVAIPQFPETPA